MNNRAYLKNIFLPLRLMVVVLLILLSGCATKVTYRTVPLPSLAEKRALYIQQLRHDGVDVIKLGETFRFVLYSDDLFNPDSANLDDAFKPTLIVLAELMATYDKVDVAVAGYTDNSESQARGTALTTRQAQVVSNFLWERGIDARLISATGYNSKNAVDSNNTVEGRHNNRRVEVSFRFYPEYVPYE